MFSRLSIVSLLLVLLLNACSDSTSEPQQAGSMSAPEAAEQAANDAILNEDRESFTVLVGGVEIGMLEVEHDAENMQIDYEYRNNGRGPTIKEKVTIGENKLPVSWTIEGNTTFGNKIDEQFIMAGDNANWKDTTGTGNTAPEEPSLYVAQEGSPYALSIYAQALLADEDHSMPVLPGGVLRLDEIEKISLSGELGELSATAYALSGIEMNPTYLLLDDENQFVATMSPRFAIVREGYEIEDERLRNLADDYAAKRFEDIQKKVAHNYQGPVRITNVHVFDPETESRSEPMTVTVENNMITAVTPYDPAAATSGTEIDGAGGTLVAGMYEMHGHLGQNSALLNIAAGITSVRDMGNNNEVLADLISKIDSGRLAGPRIIRSGFIEGKSPFSSNNGNLVDSQEEALEAVRSYSNGDYYQIKIYNSMNPEWVPAMIELAHENGLKVAGHVPAFSNADAMIAAGYDEMTHINQVMLGWVLEEGEDTRTLLRLTALQRLKDLDLTDPKVTKTIDAMVEKGVAIDPTFAIHEALLRSRNGTVAPGMVDYVDHLPIANQRQAKTAWSDVSDPAVDEAYWQAFDQIAATIKIMHERGIFIVPGTDLGGSFAYHRELELYQLTGMTPAEILAWASYGMADYLGQSDTSGSIKTGKLADFFLVPGDPTRDLKAIKTISMVVKDGTVYFPSEIYPEFGVQPFVEAPVVTQPES